MTPEFQARFLIIDGYWIPRKDIAHITTEGVHLTDQRYIQGVAA